MDNIKNIIEKSLFGVCQYIGNKIGIAPSRVRLYFIYLSFAALGSPIIVYLFTAFWLNIRRYIRGDKNPIYD